MAILAVFVEPAFPLYISFPYTLFFFYIYKNLFYRNVEAEIDPDFKNILRTYPS